jgi:hypothetical protein
MHAAGYEDVCSYARTSIPTSYDYFIPAFLHYEVPAELHRRPGNCFVRLGAIIAFSPF